MGWQRGKTKKTIDNPIKKEKKKLERKCLKLWEEIVKKRAGYKCEYSGCHRRSPDYILNAHHYFSKGGHGSVKYDPDNGMCLCIIHHTGGNEAAHVDPQFRDKILGLKDGYRAIRTVQWEQILERKAKTPCKHDLFLEKLYLEDYLAKLDPKMPRSKAISAK